MTPDVLAEYCTDHICQKDCEYNKICWFFFRNDTADMVYKRRHSDLQSYRKLCKMCDIINNECENDISKIIKWALDEEGNSK